MFPKKSAFSPTPEQERREAQIREQGLNPERPRSATTLPAFDTETTLFMLRTASARIDDEETRTYIDNAIRLIEDSV